MGNKPSFSMNTIWISFSSLIVSVKSRDWLRLGNPRLKFKTRETGTWEMYLAPGDLLFFFTLIVGSTNISTSHSSSTDTFLPKIYIYICYSFIYIYADLEFIFEFKFENYNFSTIHSLIELRYLKFDNLIIIIYSK